MPIAEYITSSEQVYEQSLFSISNYSDADGQLTIDPLPVGILTGIIGLIFFISIFLYKKRNLQARLIIFNMVLIISLFGLIYFYSWLIKSELDADVIYGFINISPILALVLAYISFYRIRIDEALVKSYDRIR